MIHLSPIVLDTVVEEIGGLVGVTGGLVGGWVGVTGSSVGGLVTPYRPSSSIPPHSSRPLAYGKLQILLAGSKTVPGPHSKCIGIKDSPFSTHR